MKCYKIRLANDAFTFSAAHFITFADGQCETLHGHDFRVAVELEGELTQEGHYVLDFVELSQTLRKLLEKWEHKILLPATNPFLQLIVQQREPEISPDIHGWVTSVGKWLTEVNDYQGDAPSPDDELLLAADPAQALKAMQADPLMPEMGMPDLPDSTILFQDDVLRADVEIRHKFRRWVFPEEDCVILPLENTTAELMADHLLRELLAQPIFAEHPPRFARLELTESAGMTGICEISFE